MSPLVCITPLIITTSFENRVKLAPSRSSPNLFDSRCILTREKPVPKYRQLVFLAFMQIAWKEKFISNADVALSGASGKICNVTAFTNTTTNKWKCFIVIFQESLTGNCSNTTWQLTGDQFHLFTTQTKESAVRRHDELPAAHSNVAALPIASAIDETTTDKFHDIKESNGSWLWILSLGSALMCWMPACNWSSLRRSQLGLGLLATDLHMCSDKLTSAWPKTSPPVF